MTTFKFPTTAAFQWFQWLVVTALGMAGAFGIVAMILYLLQPLPNIDADMFLGVVAVLLLGALTGVLQWWVLRRQLPRAWWWIIASLCGYLVILILVSISNHFHLTFFKGPWDDIALMACLGAVLGLPQYWILRQRFRKAGWWILACAVGMQALSLGGAYPAHNIWESVRLGFMMGAIFGATTGIMMAWLLQSNHHTQT